MHIQSILLIWSPLLSSCPYLKITFFFSYRKKFHMNWTSFKRSPVLKKHVFFVPKWHLDTGLTVPLLKADQLSSFSQFNTNRNEIVEQALPTLPEHLSPPLVFSGIHVTRSLVLCVCFVDHCLSFCLLCFGHCVVCSSLIYGFWLSPFGIFKLFLLTVLCYVWKYMSII